MNIKKLTRTGEFLAETIPKLIIILKTLRLRVLTSILLQQEEAEEVLDTVQMHLPDLSVVLI